MSKGQAWVTLATNDSYAIGAIVLAHSLKRVATTRPIVIMVTSGITPPMRELLTGVFDVVKEVDVMDSHDEANLALLDRPELGITFTKLHCWRLKDYSKCVFLDADTLVVENCDELFDRHEFSAAPDVGWPDCFNSGVFVYHPSDTTYQGLLNLAMTSGSFDGGDQGLLNMYFGGWATEEISRHLPFIYNMVATAAYSYLPAFKQFASQVRIVHFIGANKPWMQFYDSVTGTVRPGPDEVHLQGFLQLWWDIFCSRVHEHLRTTMGGMAATLARMKLGKDMSPEEISLQRKAMWEMGQMDYTGEDSFTNIMNKLEESLQGAPPALPGVPPPCPPSRPCVPTCPCARRQAAIKKEAERKEAELQEPQ